MRACSLKEEIAAMPRLTGFDSPLLLGFDHFERLLEEASKMSAEGYPPYNIEQTGENDLRISLAVAGFSMDDLNVTIEENQLIVRGRSSEDDSDRIFLHRGIASRQFQRSFVLAEGIEVTGAALDNGLLHVDLKREVQEPEIRTVEIESAAGNGKNQPKKPRTIDLEADEK